jgi:hypothetical protein
MHLRRFLLAAGALAVLGWAELALVARIPRPGSGITSENYDRIRHGMTEEEVKETLGCSAGNYSGQAAEECEMVAVLWGLARVRVVERTEEVMICGGWTEEGPTCRTWVGDRVAVLVAFREGRVWRAHSEALPEASLLHRLRRLLPW